MLQGTTANPTPASSFFARVNSIHRSASCSGPSYDEPEPPLEPTDIRRAKSMKVAGSSRRDVSMSFGAAGSNLSSPAPSEVFTPPAASRHPLFAHHAIPSPSITSDPGPSAPPSPSESAGSAFSPASAFLSHFSSNSSLRPANPQLAPDSLGAQVGSYVLGKVVGRGGFSTVRKCTHTATGETYACKIVKRDDLSDRSGSLEKFEEEIRIWKTLPAHASLLPLLDIHRTPQITYLITPYQPGGSLLDVLKREHGSAKTASKWLPGIVTAVAVLHEGCEGFAGGILHGDLKLDNFLVDHTGKVKVCDFYMAQHLSEPSLTVPPPMTGPSRPRTPMNGSPYPRNRSRSRNPRGDATPVTPLPSASLPYAPPELLRPPPPTPALSQDIWSIGIILHALLTDRLPFVDEFDPRLQMKIIRGKWEEPSWLGREWLQALHGCLDPDRETRWDIGRLRNSDAVTGWSSVQVRSKSRSRSRARGRSDSKLHAELLEPRRTTPRDGSVQPVDIRTPRRNVSRESRLEAFSMPEPDSRPESARGRPRRTSSGHGNVFDLSPDIDQNPPHLDGLTITRGRSPATQLHPDALSFTRPSRSTSTSRMPQTAPAFMDGFKSSSKSRSRSRNKKNDSPTSIRSSTAEGSPSASRSRSRTSPSVETASGTYTPYEYRGELGVVNEDENMRDGMRGRSGWEARFVDGRQGGRSRSRKRLDV